MRIYRNYSFTFVREIPESFGADIILAARIFWHDNYLSQMESPHHRFIKYTPKLGLLSLLHLSNKNIQEKTSWKRVNSLNIPSFILQHKFELL